MSHISRIEVEIHSLEDLKSACAQLGFQFMESQATYSWYGSYIGDQTLPEGITEDRLGKCDHAIKVPGCDYEIGVVKVPGGHHILLWDSWHRGGLEEKLGKNAGFLKQAYAVEKVKREARLKGFRVSEKRIKDRIRLVLSA